jgi:hypothetical protein
MPAGRPSKYDRAFCKQVIELGREGCGKAEIAAELCVTRETINDWAKANPEFSDALLQAHDFSLAWWEKQSRMNLATSGYQSGLWKQAMSGRFPAEPYRERSEHDQDARRWADHLPGDAGPHLGKHQVAGGFDVAWAEEAQSLSQRSLTLLRPTIRKPGSELWFSWNPTRKTDPVDVLLTAGKPADRLRRGQGQLVRQPLVSG